MTKVQVLTQCDHCKGQAYLPVGESTDSNCDIYTRCIPCPDCDGSGNKPKWVTLQDFLEMLKQTQCQHKHTYFRGGFHFTNGIVWDDITEVCDDCGAELDGQTLGNLIPLDY